MTKNRIKKSDHRLKAIIVRFSIKEFKLLQESMKRDNAKVKGRYIRLRFSNHRQLNENVGETALF